MTLKVLIVDDCAPIRTVMADLLRTVPECHLIGEGTDGTEALELVRTLKPDLVVMDIHMPRMNGIEVLRLLKNEAPETQVVMVTSILEPDVRDYVMSLGALECLDKFGGLWQGLRTIALSLSALFNLRQPVSKDEIQQVMTRELLL